MYLMGSIIRVFLSRLLAALREQRIVTEGKVSADDAATAVDEAVFAKPQTDPSASKEVASTMLFDRTQQCLVAWLLPALSNKPSPVY